MKYQEWEEVVPQDIKSDSLWKVEAYRLALFATDLGWQDVTQLRGDARTRSLSDQRYRALGSVSANIAEGYSRGTGKDRAHFYEYALGSARESRDWYYKARHILSETIVTHRFRLLSQIIRLLLVMVENQRGRTIREETVEYSIDHE
jgi:four helix bundle protein